MVLMAYLDKLEHEASQRDRNLSLLLLQPQGCPAGEALQLAS